MDEIEFVGTILVDNFICSVLIVGGKRKRLCSGHKALDETFQNEFESRKFRHILHTPNFAFTVRGNNHILGGGHSFRILNFFAIRTKH